MIKRNCSLCVPFFFPAAFTMCDQVFCFWLVLFSKSFLARFVCRIVYEIFSPALFLSTEKKEKEIALQQSIWGNIFFFVVRFVFAVQLSP